MVELERPLGRKAYFKIPHLPGSRTGSSDRTAPRELAERCLVAPRPGEEVLVQEKLDGSCVAVARLGDAVLALGREGTLAARSENPGRQMFAAWVEQRATSFRELLHPGGWLVGEWLALAHSTRYELRHEPFVVFDAFHEGRQWTFDELDARLQGAFPRPALLHRGGALGISAMLERLGGGGHGAIEPPEGAVWRIERAGRVVGMAKYVRRDKIDGALLPENSGHEAVWNWKP
ncbi:RNA ligase family protein [Sorangium sp. So ce128]|uniref:RNA ligase family protein n=1 Tax=Sorangium sp. So ce128 TaxID=3133281 RepID=UPI003F646A94